MKCTVRSEFFFMAGNASLERYSADNSKPSKKKSISGTVALIMGLDPATTQESNESVYDRERRGFVVI